MWEAFWQLNLLLDYVCQPPKNVRIIWTQWTSLTFRTACIYFALCFKYHLFMSMRLLKSFYVWLLMLCLKCSQSLIILFIYFTLSRQPRFRVANMAALISLTLFLSSGFCLQIKYEERKRKFLDRKFSFLNFFVGIHCIL